MTSHYGINWEQGTENKLQTAEAITPQAIQLLQHQTREQLDKQMDNLMKYALIVIMIMIPAVIGLIIFFIGTGMVR